MRALRFNVADVQAAWPPTIAGLRVPDSPATHVGAPQIFPQPASCETHQHHRQSRRAA